MRKQQLGQLLQFLFMWLLIRFFVVFVLEGSFVEFLLKYWLYFLIVSITYFYYYSIQYDFDKKSEFIRNAIIYGNLYLFAHIFFRPLLNITHQLFIILWLIVLWMWWSTKIRSKWKYLLQILWWIFSFFILISGMFYLYPERPDVEWFINSRKNQISVLWTTESVPQKDAYIQITNSKKNDKIVIAPYFERSLVENCKISYPSLKKQRDEKIIITSPYWDVLRLFPQSEIYLEFGEDGLIKASKLNWKVWFLSWVFNSSLSFVWDPDVLSLSQQEWIEWVQDSYKYDLVSYLKSQISSSSVSFANNTIMYNIDWKIIGFLARMFPATFSKNLRNYNEFQEYFDWIENNEINLDKYNIKVWSWWSISSFWGNIKKWFWVWKSNTYNIFR